MRILVINADCIEVNSSANLCHLAYLNGLVAAGHEVELLSADNEGRVVDIGMKVPNEIKRHDVHAMSMYERLSIRKRSGGKIGGYERKGEVAAKGSLRNSFVNFAKKAVLNLYGTHGIYSTFIKKSRKEKMEEPFDVVISLSTPVASHEAAYRLIRSRRVQTQRWIQIWEDPWYGDVYASRGKKTFLAERRILKKADRVCYVSPLTLENQKKLFPEYADKMYWQPLPHYYEGDDIALTAHDQQNIYGYFGNYFSAARDLSAFYNAARIARVEVNICGDPSNLFEETEHIHIYSRLPLDKLKPIEDRTNVLIFLCNRKGGQIPGKIYQYSATNKIILFIMDGTDDEQRALREYFVQFNRYVFCENNVDSIIKAIRKIENREFGDIENKPLDFFKPERIIENILNGGK